MAFFFIAALTGCSGYPIKVGTVDQKVDTADVDFSKGRSISASAGGFQLLYLFLLVLTAATNARISG